MRYFSSLLVLSVCSLCAAPLPVRGLHLLAPKTADIPLLVRFIREGMPKEGVNTLILEVDYRFQFRSHPEVTDPDPLTQADADAITAAARQAGVRVIPQINLLGHQSWAETTYGLLRSHPELDETPGRYPKNEGIYCRSYCPLHPALHPILFDLIDELETAFHADAFHAGMDEVFILADEQCPRCKGRLTSELYAGEVTALHDHLAKSQRQLWIWGDRLLDGATTGAGKWEGSFNGTWTAIDRIPRDVVICDWHYDSPIPGAAFFAMKGFNVIACPWRKADVALAEIAQIENLRSSADANIGERVTGFMETTWGQTADFIHAYFGEPPANDQIAQVVQTFKASFSRLRADQMTSASAGAGGAR
ncbi:MAG TPA: family 20 glycosylhydrolase [Bryobacteraceae bacterium]|nr:family 20 glycosylhydrolase [Bryobacteraceae bacterium]